jgi:RimJ/RimL family protein N-acetyltransferase
VTIALCGKRLYLTSTGPEAAEALLPIFNSDKQFNLWSGYEATMSLTEVRTDLLETRDLPYGMIWQIRTMTGMLVGVAETAIVHPPHGAWIALLLIHREFQGLGYGSEAASLLEGYLFSSPEITQIGLAVLVKNAPALTFWKKRGYIQGSQTLDTHGNDVYLYFLARPLS